VSKLCDVVDEIGGKLAEGAGRFWLEQLRLSTGHLHNHASSQLLDVRMLKTRRPRRSWRVRLLRSQGGRILSRGVAVHGRRVMAWSRVQQQQILPPLRNSWTRCAEAVWPRRRVEKHVEHRLIPIGYWSYGLQKPRRRASAIALLELAVAHSRRTSGQIIHGTPGYPRNPSLCGLCENHLFVPRQGTVAGLEVRIKVYVPVGEVCSV